MTANIANMGTATVTLGDVLNMKAGDIIPINVPDVVSAEVDGVPVMECSYGKFNNQYALRVDKLLKHSSADVAHGDDNG